MLFGLISQILESISTVYWKKAIGMSTIRKPAFSLLGNVMGFLLFIIFLSLGMLNFEAFIDFKIIAIMIVTMIASICASFLMQDVYKDEKISNVMPYENLDKLFIIIIGFFIFSDTSLYSLSVAIITIFVIAGFSIDFKSLKFPKTFPQIFFAKLLFSGEALVVGFILTKYNSMTVISMDALISITVYLFMLRIVDWKAYTKCSKEFYFIRFKSSVLGWIGYLIYLFLITDLGLVMTTLIGFFGLATTLLFSYLMLKDKPERKNIVLVIVVFILVSIGYYLK